MVSLLSIPRDLWVPSLGNKINSAYSDGGDAKSLEAVEEVTGVHPNYLLNVDFSGFQKLVDSLGGVYVNVDQYYYNPLAQSQYTGFSAIDIKPGLPEAERRRCARLLALPAHRRRLPPPGPPADVPARVRGARRRPLPRHLGDRHPVHQHDARRDLRQRQHRRPGREAPRARGRCSPSRPPPTRPGRTSSASTSTGRRTRTRRRRRGAGDQLPPGHLSVEAPLARLARRGRAADGQAQAGQAAMEAGGRSGRGESHGAERQRHRPRGVENGHGAQGLGLPGPLG